jgi:hypothetical protein
MWSVRRPKNRYKDEAVQVDSTRDVAGVRAETRGRAAEPANREAANIVVVGPPGCCGCVSTSVGASSRRKR